MNLKQCIRYFQVITKWRDLSCVNIQNKLDTETYKTCQRSSGIRQTEKHHISNFRSSDFPYSASQSNPEMKRHKSKRTAKSSPKLNKCVMYITYWKWWSWDSHYIIFRHLIEILRQWFINKTWLSAASMRVSKSSWNLRTLKITDLKHHGFVQLSRTSERNLNWELK